MSVRFTIALSLAEFNAATLLGVRRYWNWLRLLQAYLFGAVSYFLLIIALIAWDEPLTWQLVVEWLRFSLWFSLLFVVLMPLSTFVAMRRVARWYFEQMSLELPIEYEIDATGVRASNGQDTSTLRWARLYDFVQDRRFLLLRRTRRIFFALPKAQLSAEQLETILAWLREARVKER